MHQKELSVNYVEIMLSSPLGIPFPFTVTIMPTAEADSFTLKVTKGDNYELSNTALYFIPNRDHLSYLNLFEKLAADYELRSPANRKKNIKHTFKADYHVRISENLNENILYGYGDPAVIRVEEKNRPVYYLLVTSNDAPDMFPILRSEDLLKWMCTGFVFPKSSKPEWASDGELSDYWAPEMHKVGNEFRVYFVARHKESHELCIGVARSSNPEGPFDADKEPMISGNVIDPHIFVEDDGTAFLYWKVDNNDTWPSQLIDLFYKNSHLIPVIFDKKEDQITASFITTLWPWVIGFEPMERFQVLQTFIEAVIENFSEFINRLTDAGINQNQEIQNKISTVLRYMKTPMYAQKLSPDGSKLIGERIKIIENDLPWEAHLVEGMWMSKYQNTYYLFYTGNDFSTDHYGIGVAIGDSPIGPFIKMPEQFLKSTPEWWAPGHPSLTNDPNGTPTLFFHAYYPAKAGYKQFRALLSIPVRFDQKSVSILSPF